MRKVVTASQMGQMDRETIEKIGIPGVVLMENAGLGVVSVAEQLLGGTAARKHVVVVAGKGNNGGDGFVVARHLHNRGADVDVYLLADPATIKGDAKTNLNILLNMGLAIHPVQKRGDFKPNPPVDLIVDAIFGTGISGAVRGLAAEIIDAINAMPTPVLSVDLPSGLNADTGAVEGPCVRATATATMAEIKRGLLLPPGRDFAGRVHVVDISMPETIETAKQVRTFIVGRPDALVVLPRRPSDAYKNKVGLVYVLAGSTGMTGAATLTSLSALKAGSGLVYLGIPASLNAILEEKATEVITKPLPEAEPGHLGESATAPILDHLTGMDVFALGPGLGTHPSTAKLVQNLVRQVEKPTVIDADGLNNLQDHTDLLRNRTAPTVLTPHPGELSRLTGLGTREILANRIEVARRFAAEWGVVLVLKGSPSVTASPDGMVMINSSGNAGMATGGSGDVLTGLIASFIGQGLDAFTAAWLGVYVHGFAGDIARNRYGEMGLVAGDILRAVPAVLRELEKIKQGENR